jgi:hypothetical protein
MVPKGVLENVGLIEELVHDPRQEKCHSYSFNYSETQKGGIFFFLEKKWQIIKGKKGV